MILSGFDEAELQVVAQCRQLRELGEDAVLSGKGREGNTDAAEVSDVQDIRATIRYRQGLHGFHAERRVQPQHQELDGP